MYCMPGEFTLVTQVFLCSRDVFWVLFNLILHRCFGPCTDSDFIILPVKRDYWILVNGIQRRKKFRLLLSSV